MLKKHKDKNVWWMSLPLMGGEGPVHENDGTLGTVGILSINLGEYARFSRVPKGANGTLETNAECGKEKKPSSAELRHLRRLGKFP
jgi:hypothetical protein